MRVLAGITLGFAATAASFAVNSHMDRSLLQAGCSSCHESHGVSNSPMLPAPQLEVCLSCHGSRTKADTQIARGVMAPNVELTLLTNTLTEPYTHPLTPEAFSRDEPGAVTCTSCHTPHRGTSEPRTNEASIGSARLSTRDPTRFEWELCQGCHGSAGVKTQSLLDISRLTSPNNPSYHPIEAPAPGTSPSIFPDLSGQVINCTDCHGNSNRSGPRGPHGSSIRFILSRNYVTVDGDRESPQAYRLCYECHDRDAVLEASPFPEHGQHIVDFQASCATCHSAHGSVDNRSLIRYGEEVTIGGVSRSISTGLLRFESTGEGSGACYLTCHAVDHNPKSYGGEMPVIDTMEGPQPGLFGADVESSAPGPPQPMKKPRQRPADPPPR
jgi:predicted CXXCH cytochrome family protein